MGTTGRHTLPARLSTRHPTVMHHNRIATGIQEIVTAPFRRMILAVAAVAAVAAIYCEVDPLICKRCFSFEAHGCPPTIPLLLLHHSSARLQRSFLQTRAKYSQVKAPLVKSAQYLLLPPKFQSTASSTSKFPAVYLRHVHLLLLRACLSYVPSLAKELMSPRPLV